MTLSRPLAATLLGALLGLPGAHPAAAQSLNNLGTTLENRLLGPQQQQQQPYDRGRDDAAARDAYERGRADAARDGRGDYDRRREDEDRRRREDDRRRAEERQRRLGYDRQAPTDFDRQNQDNRYRNQPNR